MIGLYLSTSEMQPRTGETKKNPRKEFCVYFNPPAKMDTMAVYEALHQLVSQQKSESKTEIATIPN